jgi:hypothetical protein
VVIGCAALLPGGGCAAIRMNRPQPPPPPIARSNSSAPGVRFADVTRQAGIRFRHQNSQTPRKYMIETFGSGCAFIDYDGDGWQDILLLNNAPLPGGRVTGRPTRALYRNNRNGTFTDVTRETGLAQAGTYAMGVAVGDYDNDGREDFYESAVLGPSHLFHNEGGRFRDVAREAGVENRGRWGTSCAWLDYDRDGRLDLFVCNYVKYASLKDDLPCYSAAGTKRIYCLPAAFEPGHCVLYRNEGGPQARFRDVSARSGIGAPGGKPLGVTIWDFDGDGYPDIFVANDTLAGFLFHNERNGQFREIGVESGVAYDENGDPHSGMGIDADDLDNDGKATLVISNFQGQQTSLYRQKVDEQFVDERVAAGVAQPTRSVLGFGLLFFDYDNDGYKDIMQANGHVQDDIQEREPQVTYAQPTLLLHNEPGPGSGRRFVEVGLASGPPFTQRIVGRGLAWGDPDNDGRPDALVTANNGPAQLWRNETPTQNHWLKLKLAGTRSNRDGIGATVRVTAGGQTHRTMVRSGSSYLSQSDLRPNFGLGAATTATVEIRWPSGAVDRIEHVAADRIYVAREGAGALQ